MGTIGGYETTRELHRFREVVVYAARRSSEKEANYALKVIRPATDPTVTVWELDESPAAKVDGAARQKEQLGLFNQQKDLAATSRHWAPIHEAATTPDGAVYAAFDFYPRSVQWLQKLRVNLDAASLYHVVNSIIKGLQELRETANRPHGNLKPSNIFLAGGGKKVSRAKVLLTDLAPPSAARETDDVRALGEILYQTVTHERFTTENVQVNDSDDWRRIGKTGDGWRRLCADLCDPFTRTPPTLADAAKRVQELKVSRKVWVRPVAWSAIALVVLMIGGYTWWHAQNHKQWQRYDANYRGWFGDMQRVMCVNLDTSSQYVSEDEKWRYYFDPENRKPSYRPDYYRGDDTFSAILRNWTAASKLTDPKEINDFMPGSAAVLKQNNERIESLRQKLAEWPALPQAEEAAALLQEFGQPDLAMKFRNPAARIRAALKEESGAGVNYQPGQLPDAINELALARKQAGDSLAKALEAAREIRRLQLVFAPSDDPFLKEFQSRVATAAKPDAGSVADKDLTERLGDLANQLNKFARAAVLDIESKVKAGKWQPPPGGWPPAPAQQPGDTAGLIALISDRSNKATSAVIVQQPTEKAPDWTPLAARLDQLEKQLGGVRGVLETLEKNPAVAPKAKDSRTKFDALLADIGVIRATIDKLKAAKATVAPEEAASLRALAADVDRRLKGLDTGVKPLQGDVTSLFNQAEEARIANSELNAAQKMAEQRKSILAEQENRFAGEAELAAVWKRCLPGLKREIDPDKTEPAKLRAFFDAAAKTLEMYAKFDCPADPAPATDPDVRAFEEKLLARVAESWPAERAALLSAIDAQALCDSSGARLTSAFQARSTAYLQRQGRAQATAAVAGELRRRLDWCEVPDRETAGTRRLRDLATSVKQSEFAAPPKPVELLPELLADADVVVAAADRVAMLSASPVTFDAPDRQQLADWCASARLPAQRRTAWLGLQQMSEIATLPKAIKVWPTTEQELNVERQVREVLRREYEQRAAIVRGGTIAQDKVQSEAWLKQLTAELAEKGPATLRRFIEAPLRQKGDLKSSVAALEYARGKTNREDFNIADEQAFVVTIEPRIQLARELEVLDKRVSADLNAKDKDAAVWANDLINGLNGLAGRLEARAAQESDPRKTAYLDAAKQAKAWAVQVSALLGGPAVAPVPAAAKADPGKAGPALINWKFEKLADDVLQYSSPDPSRPAVIQFVQVADGRYLAATELSVEQANALVAAGAQKIGKTPPAVWQLLLSGAFAGANEGVEMADEDGAVDARKGPRSWIWDPKKRQQLIQTDSWLQTSNNWRHYVDAPVRARTKLPPTARGGNPHPAHPLQRISPAAAAYIAALGGTRLPTVVEWKAAYTKESQAPGFSAFVWNRRDVSFTTHVRHIAGEDAKSLPNIQYPDDRIFRPAGSVGDLDRAAVPNVPDDKVLWFCGVNSGGEVNPATGFPIAGKAPGTWFKHLIGNVAEYVSDDPLAATPAIDPAAVKKWAAEKKGGKSRLSVIGASALSPAKYPTRDRGVVEAAPNEPLEVDGASLTGYSDVGIRLALDLLAAPPVDVVVAAPQKPLVARLGMFLETARP